MSIDIVNLIESNPITKLTGNYQSKLVEKVKNTFSNYEQQLFLSSFYCYLKYDSKNDYVIDIDIDNVWKWLDFSQKDSAKRVIDKNFYINKDYKIFAPQVGGAKKNVRGGHNKEIIMLNYNLKIILNYNNMQAKLDELASQTNVCDPSKVIPQIATALYLFETKKGGHAFKKALKDSSPHAYYKIYLEPLFNALKQAGALSDNDYNPMDRFHDIMMDRAGYYYDSGPRFKQKAVLFALQKLMKNDLSLGNIFMVKEKHLIINKETGEIEIDYVAQKESFIKLIKKKKEKGQDTTYMKEIYYDFYGEYPPDL